MKKQFSPDPRAPEGWPAGFPSRSQLFGATPFGFNGATQEHIVSFLRRVSTAHALLPRSLAFHVIVPSMGIPTSVSADFTADGCYRLSMCGLGESAVRWVDLLNRFTCRSNLRLLTLSSFRNLLSAYRLIESVNRFCPTCYKEDETAGRDKYDRLLWTIRCVTACPIHKHQLVYEPKAKGQHPFPFKVPGISRIDGSSLANAESKSASKHEIETARLVAELIDDLKVKRHEISLTAEFLRGAVSQLFGGNSAALALHLGVSKSQVHGWAHEGILPSLSCVARIAIAFDCSISDVITGQTGSLRLHHQNEFPRGLFGLARRSGHKIPLKKLAASLNHFIKCNPDSTATEAANHLDVSPRFLRDNFPAQNKALVTAGRLYRLRIAQSRLNAKYQAYERLHLALEEDNTYPSRRKVMALLKQQGIRLTYAEERHATNSTRAKNKNCKK
ncbi:TniQ family protein [Paraburkholderia caribensis]|uniref:TniQ family protein n=1 Tax=Paraburkholderia caribensis TaxID=75105 RepID=UPI001D07BE73|nr:TniQ family protein [Paraburkholderia caribensis]